MPQIVKMKIFNARFLLSPVERVLERGEFPIIPPPPPVRVLLSYRTSETIMDLSDRKFLSRVLPVSESIRQTTDRIFSLLFFDEDITDAHFSQRVFLILFQSVLASMLNCFPASSSMINFFSSGVFFGGVCLSLCPDLSCAPPFKSIDWETPFQ